MITPTLNIEKKLWNSGYSYVCGIDEVGRGSFAGPVCVGAVIFPKDFKLIDGIADSKLLKPRQREKLALEIQKPRRLPGINFPSYQALEGKATRGRNAIRPP